jgi:hypothetical protein
VQVAHGQIAIGHDKPCPRQDRLEHRDRG